MRLRPILLPSLLCLRVAHALTLSPPSLANLTSGLRLQNREQDGCPAIWREIAAELADLFDGCNDRARAAIRAAFHDCINNGCDGSLALADEYARAENRGLEDISQTLCTLAEDRGVGVADMFQFAAAKAIHTCPPGPTIRTYIGRHDSSTPAPTGLLPGPNSPPSFTIPLFTSQGFSAQDLAALLGAHSVARQRHVDPDLAGLPLDSTPSTLDVRYYAELDADTAPFVLPADRALIRNDDVGPYMRGFVEPAEQGRWEGLFGDAMTRLGLLGVENVDELVDCTDALAG